MEEESRKSRSQCQGNYRDGRGGGDTEMAGVVVMLCGGTAEIWARRIIEKELSFLRKD